MSKTFIRALAIFCRGMYLGGRGLYTILLHCLPRVTPGGLCHRAHWDNCDDWFLRNRQYQLLSHSPTESIPSLHRRRRRLSRPVHAIWHLIWRLAYRQGGKSWREIRSCWHLIWRLAYHQGGKPWREIRSCMSSWP